MKPSTSGPGSPEAPSPGAGVAEPPGGHGRRLFRNTLINGLATVLSLGINFVTVAFAIRHLGNASYGVWVLAFSFSVSAGYLSISDLGLQEGMIKFVAEIDGRGESHRLGPLISSALFMLLGIAIVTVLLLLGIGLLASTLFHVPAELQPSLRALFLLLAVEAASGLPSLAFLSVLEGKQRYGTLRVIQLSRQMVFATLVVTTLLLGVGVLGLGIATAVASVAASVATYVTARRLLPGLQISRRLVSRATLRPLAGFSAWVFVGRVNGVIWRQMDKLILAAILTTTLLTGYEVATRLWAAASVASTITASAMLPATANLAAAGSRERLQQLLLRGTRYTMAISVPVTLGATVLAGPLIISWVGPSFTNMTGPTQMLLLYQVVATVASIPLAMLVGLGKVRQATIYISAAVVINLFISVALAPSLGIPGVIAGTVIGFGVTSPLYIGLLLRELDLGWWLFLRRAILPVVPAAAVYVVLVELSRRVAVPTNLLTTALTAVPGLIVYALVFGSMSMTAAERRSILGFLRPVAA